MYKNPNYKNPLYVLLCLFFAFSFLEFKVRQLCRTQNLLSVPLLDTSLPFEHSAWHLQLTRGVYFGSQFHKIQSTVVGSKAEVAWGAEQREAAHVTAAGKQSPKQGMRRVMDHCSSDHFFQGGFADSLWLSSADTPHSSVLRASGVSTTLSASL